MTTSDDHILVPFNITTPVDEILSSEIMRSVPGLPLFVQMQDLRSLVLECSMDRAIRLAADFSAWEKVTTH